MAENPSDLVGKEFVFEYGIERILPPSEKTGGVFATEQRCYRRERIVRCRDCEHAHPCPLADSEKLMCAFHDEMFVNPSDFCSWGEPREASE